MEGGGAGPDPRTLPLDLENCDSRCQNVEVVNASFQILDVLSFCD